MAEGSGQAPAGWYNDPHSPERMRYFDGAAWTNHFHQPGQLSNIGSWLSTTFSVFAKHWPGALAIAFGTSLLGSVAVWVTLVATLGDLEIVDESLVNFSASKVFAIVAVVIFALVWQGFGWLALNRYMHRAHYQANPTLGDACSHALRRLPKYLGVMVTLLGIALLVMFLVSVLAIASPVLGVFAIFALMGLGIWVVVKLSFLVAAIVAAPADAPAVRTSADVSAGRFWAVLGRILLIALGLILANTILSAVTGGASSLVDTDALAENFEVEDDGLIVRNFRLDTLFPSSPKLFLALCISSLIRSLSTLISTSAYMRLYLDSGAPSEI